MKDPQAMVDAFIKHMNEREKLDVELVYAQLRESYLLKITSYWDNGYEMKVLSGESTQGRFELYDNGANIVFEINDGYHWHPSNAEDAIAGVDAFMQGIFEVS